MIRKGNYLKFSEYEKAGAGSASDFEKIAITTQTSSQMTVMSTLGFHARFSWMILPSSSAHK